MSKFISPTIPPDLITATSIFAPTSTDRDPLTTVYNAWETEPWRMRSVPVVSFFNVHDCDSVCKSPSSMPASRGLRFKIAMVSYSSTLKTATSLHSAPSTLSASFEAEAETELETPKEGSGSLFVSNQGSLYISNKQK